MQSLNDATRPMIDVMNKMGALIRRHEGRCVMSPQKKLSVSSRFNSSDGVSVGPRVYSRNFRDPGNPHRHRHMFWFWWGE